jgi:hypothetical protein
MIENLFNPFRKRRNGFFILRQESIKSAEGQTPRNGKWAAGVVVKQFNYLMMDLMVNS